MYAGASRPQPADQHFVKTAMQAPLLTREHEQDLARRWQNDQDEDALHEMVNAYVRLAIAMAMRFRGYGLPIADLIQEGNIGLMQAAARFDPSRDVRFSTYASWWIRAAIQDYILRNWSIVRTGTTAAQKSLFFNLRRLRAQIDPASEHISTQAVDEIADALHVPTAAVETMSARLSASDRSLNAPAGEEGDTQWLDLLADDRPSPEDVVTVLRDGETRARWLNEALQGLTDRERTIIEERRLGEETVTLEMLGRRFGISKERVRQIESQALSKLRNSLEEKVDDPVQMGLISA